MDKMKKMALALTLLFFAIGLRIMKVNATQYTVGVKVGDEAEYSSLAFLPTGSNGTFTVEVIDVTAATINFSLSWNPPNPANQTSGIINVSRNQGSMIFFIAQNLNVGDVIPNMSPAGNPAPVTINDIQSREYCGQMIEVNHANGTAPVLSATFDCYWIKSSGILAEEDVVTNNVTSAIIKIQNTTTIPEFPVSSLLVLTFVVVTLSSAFVLHRKKYATRTPSLSTLLAGQGDNF